MRFFCFLYKIAILIISCAAVLAQSASKELKNDPLPSYINKWLDGPEREDFPWDVRISTPSLVLQQRNMVEIRAYFDGGSLRNRTSPQDLHFVLRVATEDNTWVPEYSHNCVPFPPQDSSFNVLEFTDQVYLRPGLYTVALIAFDPILQKGNVWRKRVKVPRHKSDKLPQLDRDLRNVAFTSKEQPLAEGRLWLPVKNNRSLCIDIVVNT